MARMPDVTSEVAAQFAALREQGMTYEEIGKATGFNRHTVSRWLKEPTSTITIDGVRICTKCGTNPADLVKAPSGTRYSWCRECKQEYMRWQARKRKYGITKDEYASRSQQQGGRCAICGKVPTDYDLRVDHDHRTGQVRGLLCVPCNNGLGKFGDSIEGLMAAVVYLMLHESVEIGS